MTDSLLHLLPLAKVLFAFGVMDFVIQVDDLSRREFVDRELVLLKIRRESESLPQLMQILEVFRAGVVGLGESSITVELSGDSERVEGLIRMGMHLYRLEPDGDLVFAGANPAADTILHRDHSRLTGQPVETAFPELAGSEAAERFRRACRFGEAWKADHFDYQGEQASGAYELHCFQTVPGACACMFS